MWELLPSLRAVCVGPLGPVADAPAPRALLPGSFNPLHHGHTQLAAIAAARLGVAVHFELSVANVDKPELPRDEAERRAAQFAGLAPVWLTRAWRTSSRACSSR